MSDIDDIVEQLKQRRDELRVQMHLATRELQDEWHELEEKTEDFVSKAKLGEEDFLLGFHVALNQPLHRDNLYEYSVTEYRSFTVTYQARAFYEYSTFDVGSLILDVIIPEKSEIIWRGYVQTEIQFIYTSKEERQQRVRKAVHKLLKDFPPH